jgi:Spy/CpxP family protein refolding chaperone
MRLEMKNMSALGTVAVAICLWALPGYAQSRSGSYERGGVALDGTGIALPLLLRAANLTSDQKTQVRQIMANHRATLQDLFSQLRAAQDQMANKLFSTEKIDEAGLSPLVQQIAQLRNQLAEEGLRVVLEIRNILTPEQLAKASQLKSQMQSLHRQMRSLWGTDQPDR